MSKINVNTWEPETGTTITAGATGDTLAISADSVTGLNVGSDAAGDILYNDGTDYTRLAKPGTPADEVLTFATGATAPSWVAAGGGLSEMDQWHLTSVKTWTGAQSDVVITDAFNRQNFLSNSVSISNLPLGTGMSESSGVWTFPSTGFWLIITSADTYYSGANNGLTRVKVSATTDAGANWGVMFGMGSNNHASYDGVNSSSATFTPIDVTNTTNVKVRFVLETTTSGGLNDDATGYMFIKIAET